MRGLLLAFAVVGVLGTQAYAIDNPRAQEVPTFIAYATATITGGKEIASLINLSTSSVDIRILSIEVMATAPAAVTGLVADFELRRVTAVSGGTNLTANIARANKGQVQLSSAVRLYTGATATTPEPVIGHVTLSSEETSAQHNPAVLYQYLGRPYETPLTLRRDQAEGLTVTQGALTAAEGVVGVRIIFMQD